MISVESKSKNVEGNNLKVRGGVSMNFTQFFALSNGHIPVVLFKRKYLVHKIPYITETQTP